jgi:hypothetical protein
MEAGTNMGTVVPWKRMRKDRQTNWEKFGQYQTAVWPGSLILGANSHTDNPSHKLSTFKKSQLFTEFPFSLAQ